MNCGFLRGLGLARPQVWLVLRGEEAGYEALLWQENEVVARRSLGESLKEGLALVPEFVEQAQVRPQCLAVLLAAEAVVQLLIRLPQAPPKEVAKMLPWELTGYLSGKLEDYAYAYQVVERTEEGQQLLVQALAKVELEQWQQRAQEWQLKLCLLQGRVNTATWPLELEEPTQDLSVLLSKAQQLDLNLCPPSAWQFSCQFLPCCQVLAVVLLLCSLSTWGALGYQAEQAREQSYSYIQELNALQPWPQRYTNCLEGEEELRSLRLQVQRLEKQPKWSAFLTELGPLLPQDTWLQSIHQRGSSQQVELTGKTLAAQSLPDFLNSLSQLPQVQQAQLLSTEQQGGGTLYRILVEVGK